jgi:hypothetical protein
MQSTRIKHVLTMIPGSHLVSGLDDEILRYDIHLPGRSYHLDYETLTVHIRMR